MRERVDLEEISQFPPRHFVREDKERRSEKGGGIQKKRGEKSRKLW